MSDWFGSLAEQREPGRDELAAFVNEVMRFLAFLLENKEFQFLWEDNPELERMARETFNADVSPGAKALIGAIPGIPESRLIAHGLLGRPFRFKLNVIASVSRRWDRVRGQFTMRGWLKQMIEAIDAVLDSVISAAGGAGGIVKEFKDALSALVKIT